MRTLIIDNSSKYLDRLVELIRPDQPVVREYSQISGLESEQYDLIILSGGHSFSIVGNEDKLAQEIALIQQSTIPILGICFGFELIAHTFDAIMQRMQTKENGILSINKLAGDPIFTNLSDLSVFESHRWVVSDPGQYLVPLARSRDGIEIIKHQTKPIYGFQFHPEMFPDQTQGDELFANFTKIVQNSVI